MEVARGGEAAAGPRPADPRREMAALRAACERRIAQGRQRTAAAASAFRDAITSARALAEANVAHREKLNRLKDQLRGLEAGLAEALSKKLNRLKDQLRGLEAGLAEALSIQQKKGSECKLASESISNAATTNEQLRSLVLDKRARRDEYANFVSNQLAAIEALEANFDVVGKKSLDEAIMWYKKFLGFQVVAGEGVKFVFNKVDMQSPDNEYLFCIRVNKDEYNLIQCIPLLKDSDELVKDLNRTNNLFKFVRIMRARFQAAATKGTHPASSLCVDTSSTTISSPPAFSVDTTSESTTNRSHSRKRSKKQDVYAKRGTRSQSTASPIARPSSTRRSPRFAAADASSRH